MYSNSDCPFTYYYNDLIKHPNVRQCKICRQLLIYKEVGKRKTNEMHLCLLVDIKRPILQYQKLLFNKGHFVILQNIYYQISIFHRLLGLAVTSQQNQE